MEYEFTKQDEVLIAEASGTISSSEEMVAHANRTVAEAVARRCTKVLILDKDLSVQLTPLDTIDFAETMDQLGLALRGLRIAVIVNSQSIRSRDFMETALINRAVRYKAFESKEEALVWLNDQPLASNQEKLRPCFQKQRETADPYP